MARPSRSTVSKLTKDVGAMHTAAPPAEAERPLQGRANDTVEDGHAGMSYMWNTHLIMLSRGVAEQICHVGGGLRLSYLHLLERNRYIHLRFRTLKYQVL